MKRYFYFFGKGASFPEEILSLCISITKFSVIENGKVEERLFIISEKELEEAFLESVSSNISDIKVCVSIDSPSCGCCDCKCVKEKVLFVDKVMEKLTEKNFSFPIFVQKSEKYLIFSLLEEAMTNFKEFLDEIGKIVGGIICEEE